MSGITSKDGMFIKYLNFNFIQTLISNFVLILVTQSYDIGKNSRLAYYMHRIQSLEAENFRLSHEVSIGFLLYGFSYFHIFIRFRFN